MVAVTVDLDDWASSGPSEPDPFEIFNEPARPPVRTTEAPRSPAAPAPAVDGDFVPYKIPTNRGRRVVSALVAMAIVIVAVAGGSVFWVLRQIDPPGDAGEAVQVVVEPGMNVSAIADRLQDQGIISNATIFRWYAGRQGGIELTPGVFDLKMNDSMGNIIDALETTAEETYVKVTFPEGFTLQQMANRLSEKVPRLSADLFMQAASSGNIVSRWAPPGTTNLEGLLFPDTYRIYGNWDEARVVQEMVSLQERVSDAKLDIEQRAALLGRTPYDILVIASLIEREAKVSEDRPKIARVIYNRIAKGWNLDIDATVLYAAPGEQTAVTKALIDATADSPYNTYKNGGRLPPTPIAAPGRASIEAALQPADGPWMFYVLAQADGTHVFAETYEQHLANVEAARAAGLLG